MAITGSVQVTLASGLNEVTLPTAGLTIVGVEHGAPWIQVPIDPSHFGVLVNTGYVGATPISTATNPVRRVHFKVDGTNLNVVSPGSFIATFYYGTPLPNSKPLTAFKGIVTQVTLSGGAGTAAVTFPQGELAFTGIAASDETTASVDIFLSFATSPGQTFTYAQKYNSVSPSDQDILMLDLKVAQTLNITIAGHSSDVIDVYTFYQ